MQDLSELLNAPEGEHYQFKEAKERFSFTEALKCCCAISNCGGGKLVFGISDKRPRQVVGSKAFAQPERTREGLIDKLRVKVDFQLYNHEGKRILVFNVNARPIGVPVQVDGVSWWYSGDRLMHMPPDVLRDIFFETEHDFSGDVCIGATLNDIDKTAIETFRTAWAEKSRNDRVKNTSVEQLLKDCGAIIDDGITYAALILFGTNAALKKYLPQSEIIFEYRSSNATGPAQHREEFLVGFFACYNQIWELINLRNDKQHYQDGFHVFDIPTFNERVARESILNAASHRNYRMGASIFIRQYSDRLVIDSPGGLPSGITLDNILDKQSPRNRLIANIFALCGLVERAGQGMNLIYELSVRDAKALPDFTGTDAYFVSITLNGTVIDEKMLLLIKKIGNEFIKDFVTEDFLIINTLFCNKKVPKEYDLYIKRLVDIGVVERTERGKYKLSENLYKPVSEAETYYRPTELSREKNKELIFNYIQMNNEKGISLRELLDMMPTLSRSQVQKILFDLKNDEKIQTVGRANKAKWFVV